MKDFNLINFAASGLQFPFSPDHEGYFTSDDTRLYFASFGQGKPLVLLHGGMGNSTNWAKQITSLVHAGYNPIVLDTRGHGRSTSGSKPFSYRLFSEDLTNLMNHLELYAAILIGWSDGACTALEMGKTKPSRVVGVIFFACNIDPTGTKEFVMTSSIENCIKRHKLDFDRMTPTLESFEELQPKLSPMQENEPNYSQADLRNIKVPVSVIQGENDEFIKLSHAQYIAKSIPISHFEIMNDVSHFAPVQDPDQFNEVVLRNLKVLEDDHLTITST